MTNGNVPATTTAPKAKPTLLTEITEAIRANGGLSLPSSAMGNGALRHITAELPSHGYMVAAPESGLIKFPLSELSEATIGVCMRSLAMTVMRLTLTTEVNGELFYGFWIEEGDVYAELAEHFETEVDAVTAGNARGQLAIYGLDAGQEITVGH